MAEATTREPLDAGELVGAARREAAYAQRGGFETTATLLARLADRAEAAKEIVEAALPVVHAHEALDDAEHLDGNCVRCRDALRRRVASLAEILAKGGQG